MVAAVQHEDWRPGWLGAAGQFGVCLKTLGAVTSRLSATNCLQTHRQRRTHQKKKINQASRDSASLACRQTCEIVCHVDGTLNRPHLTRMSILLRRHRLLIAKKTLPANTVRPCTVRHTMREHALFGKRCGATVVGATRQYVSTLQAASVHDRRLLHVPPDGKSVVCRLRGV